MARNMTVTALKTHRYRGENRRPVAGIATFSDGKTYEWFIQHDASVSFYVDRHLSSATASWCSAAEQAWVRFASPKRASALLALLN